MQLKLFSCILISMLLLVVGTTLSAVSPDGTIDKEEIKPLLIGLPAEVSSAILDDLNGFCVLTKKVMSGNRDLIEFVDKKVGLPANYEPSDLVLLSSVKPALVLNKGNVVLKIRSLAVKELQAMVASAHKKSITLDISSAYRSYSYQEKLFERYVRQDGKAEAERQSAHAGHSQHQLGLAIDFGSVTDSFAKAPAGLWLAAHAGEFGFSLSYPKGLENVTGYKFEPWHYRYIGKDACDLQNRYFGGVQQIMLKFLYEHADSLENLLGLPHEIKQSATGANG